IDITNFETELESFKTAFGKNYELASRRFQTAIDEIDKSIDHLQKRRKPYSAPTGTCAWLTTRRRT
ncbi:hypothetical protein WM40_26005, partial [Robbsia andropogonis]